MSTKKNLTTILGYMLTYQLLQITLESGKHVRKEAGKGRKRCPPRTSQSQIHLKR